MIYILAGAAIILVVFFPLITVMAHVAGLRATLTIWGISLGATAMIVVASGLIGYGVTGRWP